MSEEKTVKCAKCDCALKGPTNPQPNDRMECPRCGDGDTVERVMSEVKEYVKDQMATALVEGMRRATRGSKFLKVSSKSSAHRDYRFVVDIDL